MSEREVRERDRERPTVGSSATSWVIPAVSPTEDAISWRITHAECASSVKEQVRQANKSLLFTLSSRGKSRFELGACQQVVAQVAASYSPFRAKAEENLLVVLLGLVVGRRGRHVAGWVVCSVGWCACIVRRNGW
jgi:hypothetical protein